MSVLLADAVWTDALVPAPGLLLGLMLLAALVGGRAARLIRLPRVVGYMLAGVALKMVLAWYLARSGGVPDGTTTSELAHHAADSLGSVRTLALGLILFMIGGVFDRQHLQRVGGRIWRISVAEVGLVFLLVLAGCWAAAAIEGSGTLGERFGLALLLAAVAVETAPAATLLVLREYEAKGSTTDATLVLTGINITLSIILFHAGFLVLADCGLIELAAQRTLWLDLLLTTVGSAGIGIVLGMVLTVLYTRLTLVETLGVFFGLLLVLGAGEVWIREALFQAIGLRFSFNFLLVSLFVGVIFTNVAINTERLQQPLSLMTGPIFAVFFVLAGYNLHVEEVTELKWLGAAYVGCRGLGKTLGGWWGTRWAGLGGQVKRRIGLALLCHAGVAIGLAAFLADNWQITAPDGRLVAHPLAARGYTVILAAVVLFEVAGPLAVKWTAVQAGEVKAITLLRRPASGTSAPLGVLFGSLMQLLRLRRPTAQGEDPREMTVRQIMRSNVKFVSPDASLEDVMHFIERSRFNCFPVVDEQHEFIGMIEFPDIREIIYDPALHNLVTAVDLARPDVPLIPMDLSLGELFDKFHERDVEAFPVVAKAGDRNVVGVVEQRDLLRALHIDS
ncbi:MAG: CBS domain-containing protein, partial [Phycisphaerae bacterium]|nr:CBS domain-containing protein [Phycisphaerae bacterium]